MTAVRRVVACLLVLAATAGIMAAPASAGPGDWNRDEQKAVARAGVMQPRADGFDGDQPLSAAELKAALANLGAGSGSKPVSAASRRPTIATFDRDLVRQLGLSDVAAYVQAQGKRAGLRPPSRFGTEVVARHLKLRTNQPAGEDALELFPGDRITRAEAAHSFARVL